MYKLFKKIILFFVILAVIKFLFISYFDDARTYHNKTLAKQDFNTVFVGSSRTRFAIIPTNFDMLTKNQTKSYNFGIDAGLPPQTFDWCEDIIKSKPSVKYIFFELSGGLNRLPSSQENWRNFTLSNYLHGIRKKSSKEFYNYHNVLIKNFFKPRHHDQHLNYNSSIEEMKRLPRKPMSEKELNLTKKRNNLAEKSNIYNQLNKEYWNRINKLIDLAESKNIKIYFFIPPRLETQNELEQIAPIYRKLPNKYKIRPRHFDESLFKFENSIDEYHLNFSGAEIFTIMFADEFNKTK